MGVAVQLNGRIFGLEVAEQLSNEWKPRQPVDASNR